MFGRGHAYGAVAPLIGITLGGQAVELGGGVRVRPAATGEVAKLWPEAGGLLPADFGREPDRMCVLELERPLARGDAEPPDAPGEVADAVTAIRLAAAAPVAAGPVLFERLDWRPFGVRAVLPIAATQPAGEPTRLDSFRGALAADLRARLAAADEDPDLVRRALVETLVRGERATLVRMLDETILGLRPAPAARPPSVARALAS